MSKRTTVRSPEQHDDTEFDLDRDVSGPQNIYRSTNRRHLKGKGPAVPNRTEARERTSTAPMYQRGKFVDTDNHHQPQGQPHLAETSTAPPVPPYTYPLPGQMIPFYQGYDPQLGGINIAQRSLGTYYPNQRQWDTPPPPPPTSVVNDPAVENLKKQMKEILAERETRERQMIQETMHKTTLEVAVQRTADVVREVQSQAQLDIEIATVKAEIMAKEKAERSQREKKKIQDETRQEVEREFALKLAQEKAMRESLIVTIREEFQEKERRAKELEEIVKRIRHEAERNAYRHFRPPSQTTSSPHIQSPTAGRPQPVHVFRMEPTSEDGMSVHEISPNDPEFNNYQQPHSHTSFIRPSEESVSNCRSPYSEHRRGVPPAAPSAPPLSTRGETDSDITPASSAISSKASVVISPYDRHMDHQSYSVQVNVPDLGEIPLDHETYATDTLRRSVSIESDEEGSEAYKSARTSPIPMVESDSMNFKRENQSSKTEACNIGKSVSGRFGLPFGLEQLAIPKKDGVNDTNQREGILPASPSMNAGNASEREKNIGQTSKLPQGPGQLLSSSVERFTEERTDSVQNSQKLESHVEVAGSPSPTARAQSANDRGHSSDGRQTYAVIEGQPGGHMHVTHPSLNQSYVYETGNGRPESVQQYQPEITPIRMVPMMVIMTPYQYQVPVTFLSAPIPPNLPGSRGYPGPHNSQNEGTHQ